MSFPTVTLSAGASGGGQSSTAGTFTATISGNPDGSVSGTWVYDGTYTVNVGPGTRPISGPEHLSGTISGIATASGVWSLTLSSADPAGIVSLPSQLRLDPDGTCFLLVSVSFYVSYNPDPYMTNQALAQAPTSFQVAALLIVATPPLTPIPPTASLAGDDRPNTVIGNDVDNALLGAGGNDTITGAGGNDTIDGGTGTDTAAFGDVRSKYTLVHGGGSSWTVAHAGSDGIDSLTGIERLQFPDSRLALDIDGSAGQAYRLFQAAFDRPPDLPGLGYHMRDLDKGASLAQVAANFIASPEFQQMYGPNLTDTQFVTLLYQHGLHREPSASEVAFHLQELHDGYSRAQVLTFFSESPENQANVIGVIGNGMAYIFP